MHRTGYVGIVGSWFQAAAGLRVIANLDNGLGKEDHRPVVVIMTCQHIAAPRVESGQVYLSYNMMKQEDCCERFRGLLEEAEPGPWQQDVNSQHADVMRQVKDAARRCFARDIFTQAQPYTTRDTMRLI
eukprot:9324611-Pyramimonas_sp.AAC.1